MAQVQNGSFRLFRFAGIDVFVHWSWLLVAYLELQFRQNNYTTAAWNAVEYLTLFGIVLLHEFGHALACRQVGGTANRIMLWPLGGVAYVSPPARPGAVLWSIAAGPLVNVALVPVTIALLVAAHVSGLGERSVDFEHLLVAIAFMNVGLLVFNLLPIYPLDGGQIVQALLWFVMGRVRSLKIVSSLGLVVGVCLVALCLWGEQIWLAVMAGFIALRSWVGFQQARMLAALEQAPRRAEFACPSCSASPLVGPFWICGQCRARFDPFEQQARCPNCGRQFEFTDCLQCRSRHPLASWLRVVPAEKVQDPPV